MSLLARLSRIVRGHRTVNFNVANLNTSNFNARNPPSFVRVIQVTYNVNKNKAPRLAFVRVTLRPGWARFA